MQCTEKYFRIDPAQIAFVRFVLEACDGLAFFRTVDAATGLVCAATPPGREAELDSVLEGLAGDMFMDFAPGL
ncbi:MAG: DUF4911 domain-containing protein [Desulfatibacillaceae bacterium]|nr:DUF4911 domain-containing protein [Desulfatibacillaceae bacterium]